MEVLREKSAGGLHPHRRRLLVVEDDAVTRAMIAMYFAGEGFEVVEAATAAQCRLALRRAPADLVLMDIHLPDDNGVALAQEIRSASTVGIIFVTHRDTDLDKVLGLELVGDDYVTKPINLRELLARTRALLRRRRLDSQAAQSNDVLAFGGWLIDLTRRELSAVSGGRVAITRGEFDLLAALVRARGRPLSRDYLIEVISNRDEDVSARTVDALVSRLRRKLKASAGDQAVIVTVTDIGYKLGMAVENV